MYPILLTLGENIDKVFSSFDLWVFHFFGSMQCTFLTYVAKFFTTFGDEGFIIPLVVLGIVLCFFKKTRKFGFSLIIAVVIGTLVTNIVVKPMALRIRPYNTLQGNSDYWNWYIGAGALGENDEDAEIDEYREKIEKLHLPQEADEKLHKELQRLEKQPYGSAEASVIRNYLDVALELPWNTRTRERTDIRVARRILDEDHFGLEKVKDRITEYLAVRQLAPDVKGGVLSLVGPPGTGKTSIAMSIAHATNRKLSRISLGGVHDEAEIREYEELVPMFERMRDLAAILRKKRMKR